METTKEPTLAERLERAERHAEERLAEEMDHAQFLGDEDPHVIVAAAHLADIKAVRERMKWKSMSDDSPSGCVLLCLETGRIIVTDIPTAWRATHWMPLPETPNDEQA